MTAVAQTWTAANFNDYPASPYPGARPVGSWRVTASGELHRLAWRTNSWVDQATAEPVRVCDRHLVLGYGSNLNPKKLVGRFPGQEVVVLEATVLGWAAAWCHARRASGDVVATLAQAPGSAEVHAVSAVTDQQLEEM